MPLGKPKNAKKRPYEEISSPKPGSRELSRRRKVQPAVQKESLQEEESELVDAMEQLQCKESTLEKIFKEIAQESQRDFKDYEPHVKKLSEQFVDDLNILSLLSEEQWKVFQLPVGIEISLKKKIGQHKKPDQIQPYSQKNINLQSDDEDSNSQSEDGDSDSQREDQDEDSDSQIHGIKIFYMNKEFLLNIPEECKQSEIQTTIHDLLDVSPDTKLQFLDEFGANFVLTSKMPKGTKIHVSVYVPPDSASIYNGKIYAWASCKQGTIKNDAEGSTFYFCEKDQGNMPKKAYAQTAILPQKGIIRFKLALSILVCCTYLGLVKENTKIIHNGGSEGSCMFEMKKSGAIQEEFYVSLVINMDERIVTLTKSFEHDKFQQEMSNGVDLGPYQETKYFGPGNYKLVWTDAGHGVNVKILK